METSNNSRHFIPESVEPIPGELYRAEKVTDSYGAYYYASVKNTKILLNKVPDTLIENNILYYIQSETFLYTGQLVFSMSFMLCGRKIYIEYYGENYSSSAGRCLKFSKVSI